jgi:CBS-domain-containing membrane protein
MAVGGSGDQDEALNEAEIIAEVEADDAARQAMPLKSIGLSALGVMLAITLMSQFADLVSMPLVLASFGSTGVLVFVYPDLPFSQPRNVVLGHFFCSLVGLIFLAVCGPHGWSMGLATGAAIGVMALTRTIHPPACSNPIIVFLTQPGWDFLLYPTLTGALVVTIFALLYNHLAGKWTFAKYW